MANITALLAALSNLPPMGGAPPLTPLPGTTQPPTDFILPQMLAGPEAPPPSPAPPLDQNLIARIMATGGPPPTPPTPQASPGMLDKLAAALSGIGAGIQGQGPQYVASLREERQRPQREYEARQQQYEQQQRQLRLLAVQSAQSQQERQQNRQDRAAENQFNRDFQESMHRMGITDTMAIEKMREGAQIQRDKERERAMDEKLAAQQKAQQEQTARLFANKYRLAGATKSIANELGNYDAKLTDQISPEAAKWESSQAQANQIRARREARLEGGGGRGGGGSGVAAQKALAQFESVKQQVADASARGDATAEMQLRRTMNAAFTRLSRFPGQFDLSYDQTGQWPTATPRTGAAALPTSLQPPPSFAESMLAPGNRPTAQGGQMHFDLSGKAPTAPAMNRAQAKAKLVANGYKPAEADAELNRLGIK